MEIAQKLAGFSLGQADNLRRAIGKKKASEIKAMKQAFITGMGKTCGVKPEQAKPIYDLIEKFADYGFNKSHAAAYALVSYQTAYLKVHHPVECLAAAMNMEIRRACRRTRNCLAYRSEARRLGITVPPPCVNHSGARFCPAENSIPYALGRGQRSGRRRGRRDRGGTQGGWPVCESVRSGSSRQPQEHRPGRARETRCRGCLRCARAEPPPGVRVPADADRLFPDFATGDGRWRTGSVW